MTAPTNLDVDTVSARQAIAVWRFGDCVLEPAKRQLSNAQGPVAVEPQVIELLIYLLENRERLVSKEDLVTHVWRGRHVTDAAISAGVKKARAAVGDDGAAGRIIATVYGRGYRFVATVETVYTAAARDAAERDAADVTLARSARRGRRYGPLVGLAALLFVLLIVAGFVFRGYRDRQPPRLAIGVLAPASGWSAREGEEMLDDLRNELAVVEGITLLAPLGDRAASFEAMAEVTREHDADAALVLRLAPATPSDSAHMSLHLVEPAADGDRMVQLVRYPIAPGDGDARRAVLRVAVHHARVWVEERTDQQEGGRAARAEARRLVTDALGSWRVSCRDRELLGLLSYAVERDPTFAQGWYALAITRSSIAFLCLEGRTVLPQAFEALAEARRLAPTSSEALQLEVSLLQRTGQEERSMRLLLEGLSRDPDSFFVRFRAAEILRYAGQLGLAQTVLDGLERREPGFLAITDTVPYPMLYRGEWHGFLEQTSRRDSAYFAYFRGFALWRLGREDAALEELARARSSDPSDVFAQLADALAAIVAADRETARARLETLDRRRLTEGPTDGEMTYKVAQLLALAGDRSAALTTLERALEEGFFCAACIEADAAWSAWVHEPAHAARFQALIERVRERERAFASRWLPPLVEALELADFSAT